MSESVKGEQDNSQEYLRNTLSWLNAVVGIFLPVRVGLQSALRSPSHTAETGLAGACIPSQHVLLIVEALLRPYAVLVFLHRQE